MKQPPVIVVQLIHIEGPLKGQIQEFRESEITIGRHSANHVCFPKDLSIVSRQHARIVREGNRFMLVDKSTNGTFVNGKPVKETVLKDGDVLLFAQGGPKVSFLAQVMESGAEEAPAAEAVTGAPPTPQPGTGAAAPIDPVAPEPPPKAPEPPPAEPAPITSPPPSAAPQPVAPDPAMAQAVEDVPIQQVKKPLVIQYGPTLQAYNTLPVIIGNGPACDFKLDHPGVFERHAQVFFYQDKYWVKDLTGKNILRINGVPVTGQGMLTPEVRLALSESGPEFRFLGGGRLAEIEPEAPDPGGSTTVDQEGKGGKPGDAGKGGRDLGSMMKRLLKR